MIGSIIGDVVGMPYEFTGNRDVKFIPFMPDTINFTDDTVLTIATANAILDNNLDFKDSYSSYAKRFPDMTYGNRFVKWMYSENKKPYNSMGNGAAMRVSPIALLSNCTNECIDLAIKSAKVTHNHEQGILGAVVTAVITRRLLHGATQSEILHISKHNYSGFHNTYKTMTDLRKNYKYSELIQDTVPAAVYCFIYSSSYEDVIRNASSIGGDADTIACIAGSMAEHYYGIPNKFKSAVLEALPKDFKDTINRCYG